MSDLSQVFLNHKTEDKRVVQQVKHYLSRCLIACWLDCDNMVGGSKLAQSITEGIAQNRYFLAFISAKYLRSDWCIHELQQAYQYSIKKQVTIIPILLQPQSELDIDSLPSDDKTLIQSLLDGIKYIAYDPYDPDKSHQQINEALGKYNKIRFFPVKTEVQNGKELSVIEFDIPDNNLPSDFLTQWKLNIEDNFIAYRAEDKDKPLRAGEPVALNGKGPNWLYAHMAIPFKNLCPVYIYNNVSKAYICVYELGKRE